MEKSTCIEMLLLLLGKPLDHSSVSFVETNAEDFGDFFLHCVRLPFTAYVASGTPRAIASFQIVDNEVENPNLNP